MIALGRSPIAGPSSPYSAKPAGVVAAVPRGRGRTSGVPVSGSEMTWTARPKTSSTIRIGAGTILGGPSRACSGRKGGARGVCFGDVMVGGFMRGQVARIHLRWTRPRLPAKAFRSGGRWPSQMDDSAISGSSSGRSD